MEHAAKTVYSYSYSNRKKNFSSSIAIDKVSNKEADQILDHYRQLINDEYRGYFYNKLVELGKRKFTTLADRAIKYGRDPQKMFNHLLK